MNPLAQLGQQGQQGPSTSPFGQQGGMGQQQPFQQGGMGQQQPFGQQMQPFQQQGQGMLEQLQQLGQQQPFQQLLQQFGQGQQGQVGQQEQQQEQQVLQHLQQVTQSAVQQVTAQPLQAGIANAYISVVQPLPGQPRQIFLRINNQFRVLNHPTDVVFEQVQEAFAFGHQVIGIWDTQTPHILRAIYVRKV
ncbi:hypothetical protein ABT381_09450 [Streptomyces sp. NPDC000151]|uniref:hypothetical protein n=1 Tax=Streptomyces sp. NPDC000151 TaxID=3154244 RepID=UPI00331CF972